MPRWPVNLLMKLLSEPRIAIGGAAPTAEAFLPSRSDAPAIQIGPRPYARSATRRWTRRSPARRRLVS